MDKPVLDVTCASRSMWFDKRNPNAVFSDRRTETHTLCDGRVLEIAPDVEAEFTDLPFPDRSFRLVVFDPPHLEKLGQNSWMAKKYGVLIFKWNEHQIKLHQVKPLFPCEPLFGHTTSRNGETIWVTFMKIP